MHNLWICHKQVLSRQIHVRLRGSEAGVPGPARHNRTLLRTETKCQTWFPKTDRVYAVPNLVLPIQNFYVLSNAIAIWGEIDHTPK